MEEGIDETRRIEADLRAVAKLRGHSPINLGQMQVLQTRGFGWYERGRVDAGLQLGDEMDIITARIELSVQVLQGARERHPAAPHLVSRLEPNERRQELSTRLIGTPALCNHVFQAIGVGPHIEIAKHRLDPTLVSGRATDKDLSQIAPQVEHTTRQETTNEGSI